MPTSAIALKLGRVSLDLRVTTLEFRGFSVPVLFPELGCFVVALRRIAVRVARPLVPVRSVHVRKPL